LTEISFAAFGGDHPEPPGILRLGATFQVAIRSREQRFFSGRAAVAADAFDRRIVTLLAFGPVATLFLMSLLTGRDTVPLRG
jgi:hypothetical protein